MSSKLASMHQSSERFTPQPIRLDPFVHKFSNSFLRKIEEQFHQAQVYGHLGAKENARRKFPASVLMPKVQRKFRGIQKAAKKDSPLEVDIQDVLLVEVLRWFKEEFFEWVDQPKCENCENKTVYQSVRRDSDSNYAKRIEVFKCQFCGKNTFFPRYNDVNILLETRKGRCGEWANVFTLMCCSLNFDARLVVDETDHVWTEVYSPYQKRWLHCDPCEGTCDTPLMYEHGWKKKLSYVIAYSPYEVQDVTWRYTSNYKEVLKRRQQCSEAELVRAIVQLRNERLSKFSKEKRLMIQKRTVLELADFLTERQPGSETYGGRTSGSLDWRIARQDVQLSPEVTFFFSLSSTSLSKKEFLMKYSCSTDRYDYGTNLHIDKWDQGTFARVDMMRKVEKDWNQVYLCRKEGTNTGSIEWMFKLNDLTTSISSVYIKLKSETFENGKVEIKAVGCTSDGKENCLEIGEETKTVQFQGCNSLRIKATVSGGKGKEAWQHAQLFRQQWTCDQPSYPFEVFLTFQEQ